MNKKIRDIIWNDCMKANRFLHIPGIYKHFKQTKNSEDMIYALSNVSIAILDEEEFKEIFESPDTEYLNFYHT